MPDLNTIQATLPAPKGMPPDTAAKSAALTKDKARRVAAFREQMKRWPAEFIGWLATQPEWRQVRAHYACYTCAIEGRLCSISISEGENDLGPNGEGAWLCCNRCLLSGEDAMIACDAIYTSGTDEPKSAGLDTVLTALLERVNLSVSASEDGPSNQGMALLQTLARFRHPACPQRSAFDRNMALLILQSIDINNKGIKPILDEGIKHLLGVHAAVTEAHRKRLAAAAGIKAKFVKLRSMAEKEADYLAVIRRKTFEAIQLRKNASLQKRMARDHTIHAGRLAVSKGKELLSKAIEIEEGNVSRKEKAKEMRAKNGAFKVDAQKEWEDWEKEGRDNEAMGRAAVVLLGAYKLFPGTKSKEEKNHQSSASREADK